MGVNNETNIGETLVNVKMKSVIKYQKSVIALR